MTKNSPRETADEAWLEQFLGPPHAAETVGPAFHPTPSRSEQKIDQATQVARELTDAATEKREAITARLKAARLRGECEARALGAGLPPKKKGHPGAKSQLARRG